MPLPESFAQHLRDFGYHPRSNKHSNALGVAIARDLTENCRQINDEAADGNLVYDLNMDLRVRTATWNVDLVLGTPAAPADPGGSAIAKLTPSTVRVAIEIKSVMTEHRKAVKNRKRDFEAHHEHVHNYNPRAIAGAVMVVNASNTFASPLRMSTTSHGDERQVKRLVEHCTNEMRNIAEAGGRSEYGMDAKAVIVVNFDNINLHEGKYVSGTPAPTPGDPLHYDSFIQRLCAAYKNRFGSG